MKIQTKVNIVFAIIGYTFLIIGIAFGISRINFLNSATKTSATVINLLEKVDEDDGDILYRPVVTYTSSNGQKIEAQSDVSSNPPRYEIGDKVNIYYQLSNPKKIVIDSFMDKYLFPIVFGIFGIIFSAIGTVGLIKAKKQSDHSKLLRERGRMISTTLVEVRKNINVEINGQNPYIVVSQWQDPTNTQNIYTFESEDLMQDPTPQIANSPITVYIDPNNPKDYYMDLSNLPKQFTPPI